MFAIYLNNMAMFCLVQASQTVMRECRGDFDTRKRLCARRTHPLALPAPPLFLGCRRRRDRLPFCRRLGALCQAGRRRRLDSRLAAVCRSL